MPHHLMALQSDVMPVVNQIEHHIGYMQIPTMQYCKERNILVEAWSPLGRSSLIDDEIFKEVAAQYNVSTAQLALRFCLQNGTPSYSQNL